MGGKRIDHTQVYGARIRGLKPSVIAKRLGCSERTVRRICDDLPKDLFISDMVETDQEWTLWLSLKLQGKSYREIGRLYCLSHEHIRQVLNEKKNNQSTINEKEAA